jgi:hypothetical protein
MDQVIRQGVISDNFISDLINTAEGNKMTTDVVNKSDLLRIISEDLGIDAGSSEKDIVKVLREIQSTNKKTFFGMDQLINEAIELGVISAKHGGKPIYEELNKLADYIFEKQKVEQINKFDEFLNLYNKNIDLDNANKIDELHRMVGGILDSLDSNNTFGNTVRSIFDTYVDERASKIAGLSKKHEVIIMANIASTVSNLSQMSRFGKVLHTIGRAYNLTGRGSGLDSVSGLMGLEIENLSKKGFGVNIFTAGARKVFNILAGSFIDENELLDVARSNATRGLEIVADKIGVETEDLEAVLEQEEIKKQAESLKRPEIINEVKPEGSETILEQEEIKKQAETSKKSEKVSEVKAGNKTAENNKKPVQLKLFEETDEKNNYIQFFKKSGKKATVPTKRQAAREAIKEDAKNLFSNIKSKAQILRSKGKTIAMLTGAASLGAFLGFKTGYSKTTTYNEQNNTTADFAFGNSEANYDFSNPNDLGY